jgi:hypothetical protein
MIAGKIARRARNGIERAVRPAFRRHDFASPEAGERRAQPVGSALLQLHPPGRDVAGSNADHSAQLANRRQHIGPPRLEQRLLGQRPGGDEAHDIARHQCFRAAALLRLCRAFDLLGDGNPAAGLDQPREVALRRVHRHPAHRDRLAAVLAAAGEGNVEHLRGHLGIVEEQLEEIAHPVEQQAILRLRLQREVLGHHRGGGIRGVRAVHRSAVWDAAGDSHS